MDIPLVLEQLRPGEDWGPCAQSASTYDDLAKGWRGKSPVPTREEMELKWVRLESLRRKPRQREALKTDLAALSNADRNKVLIEVLADALLAKPKLARLAGVNLDGDEPGVT